MTLPTDLPTFTLTGTYKDFEGNPLYGKNESVIITYSTVVSDAANHVVLVPRNIVEPLDENGSFTKVLPVTQEPSVTPNDFTITLKENFTGGRIITFTVPAGVETINVDEIAQYVTPAPIAQRCCCSTNPGACCR